jgi:hypothetical protein
MLFLLVSQVEGLAGDSKVKAVNLGGWLVVEGWIKPSLFDGIPNGDMLVSFLFKFCFLFCFFNASWIYACLGEFIFISLLDLNK